ncbi:MAG: amino acid adenylation domain-containing protein, partial [Cytophagales bacterium]|nr:amino acid adenylation domain-containing protein [Cytophagales bacterium]
FDLSLYVNRHPDSLSCTFEYNTGLFRPETIARFTAYFRKIIAGLTADPDRLIAEMPILSAKEEELLQRQFTPAHYPFPGREVHKIFEEQVRRTPHRIALVTAENECLTYEEVNGRSNQLAALLRRKGVGDGSLVGMLVDRSPLMVIGIMAVLKAGGAYVPILPSYPAHRIGYMLDDCGAQLVLTLTVYAATLGERPLICLDEPLPGDLPAANPGWLQAPDALAYVLYTSGSTGKPKGVMITHQALTNVLCSLNEYYNREGEVYLLKTPYTFDVSATELFGWFFRGGRLVVLEKDKEADVDALCRTIGQQGVSRVNFVPSMFRAFVDLLDQGNAARIAGLRYIMLAGEALDAQVVRKFRSINAHIQLENIYGPTEAAVYSSKYSLSEWSNAGTIPIGRPMHNVGLLVVDDYNKLVPVGMPGELCIWGKGLASGYLNQPALTREKFVDHPFREGQKMYRTGDLVKWMEDGNVAYLGRIDDQVKVRGYRIELGEIESLLGQHPAVREAVVLARETPGGGKSLCAYIVAAGPLPVGRITRYLQDHLPFYMVPSHCVMVDALPVNKSGKLDRAALPDPARTDGDAGRETVAAGNELEAMMVGIWEKVLGIEKIGIRDGFFALGGDSIKILQVLAALYRNGYQLAMKDFFGHPTIEALARKAEKHAYAVDQGMIGGKVPLAPIQQWFLGSPYQPKGHFNQAVMLRKPDGFGEEAIRAVFGRLLAHHDALRMRFKPAGRAWEAFNDADTSFDLAVHTLVGDGNVMAEILPIANALQESIDLANGPLVKLALFRHFQADHLLIIIHHLVVDGLSWRILLEDIDTLYKQYENRTALALPPKTDAYKRWSEKLRGHARSEAFRQEIPYWKKVDSEHLTPLATDYAGHDNCVKDEVTQSVYLDVDTTAGLLTQVPAAYGTHINESLLSSLALAVSRVLGTQKFAVALEGHGREEIFRDVNVSRTVGWFTSLY